MLGGMLAAAVVATMPSGAWMELEAGLRFDGATIGGNLPRMNAPPGESLGTGAKFGITIFGRRLRDDDDAAPSLQPFLQRVARVHFEGEGADSLTRYPLLILQSLDPRAVLSAYRGELRSGVLDASAEGYPRRWLYLYGRFTIRSDTWGPAPITFQGFGSVTDVDLQRLYSSELRISPSLALGARWRDLVISAGWNVTAYRLRDNALSVRFWGGAFVALRAVIDRRVDLAARVEVLDGGALAEASLVAWFRRRVGVTVALEGGAGAFADSPVEFARAGGRVGVSWWASPTVAASLDYAPSWQHSTPVAGLGMAIPDFWVVAHSLMLTMMARMPATR